MVSSTQEMSQARQYLVLSQVRGMQVEHWVTQQGDKFVGGCWDELRFIRQAVAYLVLHAKQKKTLKEIQTEMCPELSVQQLYRISTMYWDDKFGTETVSGEVLQEMRHMMQVRACCPVAGASRSRARPC
jgi:hypothetical protein